MADEEVKGVPRDFVYLGDREVVGGMGSVVIWIDGGKLGERSVFKTQRKKGSLRVIGGVYTGASFDGDTAYGLRNARYTGKWSDKEAVAAWEAESDVLETEAKLKRLADADAKDIEFDKLTIARLRVMHFEALQRGDYQTASALTSMARMRITRKPTKDELERES